MFLGLDLGTSELKALLLTDQHQVLASARAPLTVQRPHALWAEQHPADWWLALQNVMASLQAQQPQALARLQAIGLSGQMHGAVLLDQNQAVLRPAILWNDGRSSAQCQQLSRDLPSLSAITGNLAMPGFTAPKLQWVREHEPGIFAQTRRVLLPKDWLRLMLTGEAVSDMSDAAGTLWLDVGQRDWSDALLHATGLTRAHMPRLVEGSELAGHVLPELCQRWGLPAGVPVAGGAGDNAASAIGMGLVQPGQGFVSLGTSGVVFVSSDRFAPNPAQALHTFCHALPNRWHQMSVMLSAASAVTWATRVLGLVDEAQLLTEAASLNAHELSDTPLFLPYLSGERSPHNNPEASGAWTGLRAHHRRAHLAYAVAEGVGFGLLDGLRTMSAQTPALQTLSLVGGGSRSAWWAQLLADTLGVSLTLHQDAEHAGAIGAARLAWLASGGALDAVAVTPAVRARYTPNPAHQARLAARHQRFQALYRDLHRDPSRAPHSQNPAQGAVQQPLPDAPSANPIREPHSTRLASMNTAQAHSRPAVPLQVATAGEALIDLIEDADGRLRPCAGGAVYNATRALALQGVGTLYLNPLSSDRFGRLLAHGIHQAGVTLAQPEPVALPTSLAVVGLDAEGKASYSFYREGVADRQVNAAHMQQACASHNDLRIVATGCLALVADDQAKYLPWLRSQRAAGRLVVVDANLRPAIVADMAAYRASVLAALGQAHLIKVSDDDLVTLGMTDADPLVNARTLLAATPAQWLALTLGAQGAVLLHRDGHAWHSRETAPVTVADTVGAGDCFLAGLLVALLALPRFQCAHRVDELAFDEADVARLLGHAVASASLCVQQTGCVPPTLAQVQARLAAAPPTCSAV